MLVRYCFDTSAFMEPWNKHYQPEVLPVYWENLDKLIETRRVYCPEEVYQEILVQDDSLAAWIKKRKDKLVSPISVTVQQEVRFILQKFPKLIKVKNNHSMADPWVVAQAIVDKSIVVTKEIIGANTDIKIPNVCQSYGIEYIDEIELAKREKLFQK